MINPMLTLFDEKEIVALAQRLELLPQLVLRQQEELIVKEVPLPSEWLEGQRKTFLADQSLVAVLEKRGWSESDLIHLRRPEALRRFKQRFGPGLEETSLASRGGRDQVIYSLLRVRSGLARVGSALRRANHLCGNGSSAWGWR